jgi:hypothetical protein
MMWVGPALAIVLMFGAAQPGCARNRSSVLDCAASYRVAQNQQNPDEDSNTNRGSMMSGSYKVGPRIQANRKEVEQTGDLNPRAPGPISPGTNGGTSRGGSNSR